MYSFLEDSRVGERWENVAQNRLFKSSANIFDVITESPSKNTNMEFPHLGKHCSIQECKQLGMYCTEVYHIQWLLYKTEIYNTDTDVVIVWNSNKSYIITHMTRHSGGGPIYARVPIHAHP